MPEARASDSPFTGFGAFIQRHASERPDKVYLHSVDQGTQITYGGLARLTAGIARLLADARIRASERVMLLGGNSLEHAAAYLGVLRYGACVCTVNVESNARHLDAILATVAPRLVIHEPSAEIAAAIGRWPGPNRVLGDWPAGEDGAVPALGSPDDPGVIFYTSGTDAAPKGVAYTHATLFHNTDAGMTAMDIGVDDRVLDFRSCAWVSAQEIALLGPLIRGATAILARRFSRSRYLEWIRDYRVSVAACVPAGLGMLTSEPVDLSAADMPALRYIGSSSAPLHGADTTAFERRYGIIVAQSFGSSELGWIAGSNGADRRIGSAGRATRHQRVEIVDEAGAPLPPGEPGRIRVTSARQRMLGYLRPDGTIEALPPGPSLSGDLGYLDADGYLFVTGRASDLIIRGGINIAPLEIDSVLAEFSAIAEACTIGVPDPIWGEEVVSYVAAAPGRDPSEAAIIAHCGERLPPAKVPKAVIFREALPRNDRGKLDRNALRADWERNQAAAR